MNKHFYESINGGEPTCIDEEIPFEIPDSWEWCRCSALINLQSGQDLTPDKYNAENKGVPYITGASNLEIGKIIINRWTEHPKTLAFADDILISCKGTVGELAILKEPSVHIARQIMAMRLLDISQQGYLYLFWLYQVDSLREKQQGLIPGISRDNILDTLIPLPLVNEQERICSAVAKRNNTLQKIEDSRTRYKRILFETPTSLRQQLIQSAIQGLLVPQNPDDEPASVLLKCIAEERVAKLGKKAAKSMSRIERRGSKTYELFPDGSEKDISEEIPFEIPDSWEWGRLSYISNGFQYGTSQKSNSTGKYAVLRMGNIQNGEIDFSDLVYSNNDVDFSKLELKKGDVLFNRTNSPEWVGKTAIFRKHKTPCIFAGYLIRINQSEQIIGDYLNYFLNSSCARKQGNEVVSLAVNQANISGAKLSDYFIPIPPLLEQHRIVEKLGALLKLV